MNTGSESAVATCGAAPFAPLPHAVATKATANIDTTGASEARPLCRDAG